jgi:hypothetical protein
MKCVAILALGSFGLFGQLMVDLNTPDGKNFRKIFDRLYADRDAPKLSCSVYRFPARIQFNFNYWGGYVVEAPVKQFPPERSKMLVAARVVAKKQPGLPVYFTTGLELPERPADQNVDRVFLSLGGGFQLGPGEYDVQVLLTDEQERVCRKDWSVEAKGAKVPVRLAPDAIDDSGVERWQGFSPRQSKENKVTVLLHAAPLMPRRNFAQLSPVDLGFLMNSLKAVLEEGPFGAARVVVFDFSGRRVLGAIDNLTPQNWRELVTLLRDADFGRPSFLRE